MESNQNVKVGICLALTTAVFWGALPIAMKQVLQVMEPYTIVWYRFLIASVGLFFILYSRKQLPPMRVLSIDVGWFCSLLRPAVYWVTSFCSAVRCSI